MDNLILPGLNETIFNKIGLAAFDGLEVAGRVVRVVLRGEVVFEDGRVPFET